MIDDNYNVILLCKKAENDVKIFGEKADKKNAEKERNQTVESPQSWLPMRGIKNVYMACL